MNDIKAISNDELARRFYERYSEDPILFQVECLDVERCNVWGKMEEVALSVRDNQRTCVYAGHSVSKSFEAARLALWFLFTKKPSTVITTAPIFDLVEKVLWKEIHTAYSNAKIPLGGKMTKTQLEIDPKRKWFAYGFSAKPDTVTAEATSVQGKHNENVLVILDEAAAILPQIWKAVESLLVDSRCKCLAIGNPTSSQGTFAELENDPAWNFINISVLDTPNYKEGKTVIQGLSGREYEEAIRVKYGIDSNEYAIRVLGRKPEFTQGTYLGKQLAALEAKEGSVGIVEWERQAPVYLVIDYGNVHNAMWFVQFIKNEVRLIDFYYDGEGKGAPEYAAMLKGKGYVYGGYYGPADMWGSNSKSGQTGRTTIQIFNDLGIPFQKIQGCSVDDRVEAARGIVPKCRFGRLAMEGFNALKSWRQRKNESLSTPDKPVYYKDAVKDWTRHCGDSFSYLAVLYRYLTISGERVGQTTMNIAGGRKKSAYKNDILSRGILKKKCG